MMQQLPHHERITRNVETMKASGASEVEIDRYLVSEGVRSPLGHIWRRPLVSSGRASASELADLQSRYGLEA